ncbi:MAG TPA: riboflavin biosynthesis protein RibF, partial [Porphyromonadaceae bacterium]|nr:riboflavin biosynthesis protein RibF [Porphyromonadaceae bacterium]
MDLSSNEKIEAGRFVATVGFFDGVHIGHRYLIEQVKKKALELTISSAVITFPVHPRKVLQKDYQPALLCGYDEK